VTTIAAVHTEFLGSLEGVREEKAGLVRALTPTGVAVLNADDARVAGMARDTQARVVTYGRAGSAHVRAVGEVTDDEDGLRFTLEAGGERQAVTLALAGRHNVTNALAAAAAGVALGFPLAEIAAGLGGARAVAGRCVWRQAGEITILDDTYNASPVSVRAALDTVSAHRRGRRVVIVLGDMLELGNISDEAHREVGRLVAALPAHELIGLGRATQVAVEAAREGGMTEARHFTTFEDTVAHLLKRLAPGDLVLVKGSRGMRMERVVDALVARLARSGRDRADRE
jgi:UDP-N-acetylmuramoyl-tripeptide--D-alanyl-D-alanine ligase